MLKNAEEFKTDSLALAKIPVLDTGLDFPLATLRRFKARTLALLEDASRRYPAKVLVSLDKVSRAWLVRWDNAHLAEIDEIAKTLDRPGAYFFSVNYEWGCTCRVAPSPDGQSARLIRVLDWKSRGLGRNFVAARVTGAPAGPFAVLTWPGYSGVLQVMAPGRFAAALNQAPMRVATGLWYVDWAVNRRRVWTMPHQTPAHLLRTVSETARTFAEARKMLIEEPISTPAIFMIAGVSPEETAVIERREENAAVRDGATVAANHWQSASWGGHARGCDSPGRSRIMSAIEPGFDTAFPWLNYPILNDSTRLVMIADAKQGRFIAQGYEQRQPATALLDVTWQGRA